MSKKFNSDFNDLLVTVKYQLLGNEAYLDRYGDEMMVASNTNFNENPSFFSGMHNYFEWAKLSDDEVLAIFDYYTWDSEASEWTKLTEIPEDTDNYEEEEDVPTTHTEGHDHVKVLNIELVEDEFCPKFEEDTQEQEDRGAHIAGIEGMKIGDVCKVEEEGVVSTETKYYHYDSDHSTWIQVYEEPSEFDYEFEGTSEELENWESQVEDPQEGDYAKIIIDTLGDITVYYKYVNQGQENEVSTCAQVNSFDLYYDLMTGSHDYYWSDPYTEPLPDTTYTEFQQLPTAAEAGDARIEHAVVRGTGSEKIKVQFDISEDLLLQFHQTRYFQPIVTIDGKEYTLKVLTNKIAVGEYDQSSQKVIWEIIEEGEEPEPLTFYLNRDHRVTITWAPGKIVEEFLFIANRL